MESENLKFLRSVLEQMSPINEDDWKLVKENMKPVTFKRKERLIDLESVSDSYIFIGKGLARLYGYKEGEEKTLFFFKEGMFAGSIQSYLFERSSELVLEAMEEIDGLEITKEGFDEIFARSPNVMKIILIYTQLRLNALLQFFSSFVLDSPEERYEKFVATQSGLLHRVPQHIIASFLGVTPVSLSRIRKRIFDKR